MGSRVCPSRHADLQTGVDIDRCAKLLLFVQVTAPNLINFVIMKVPSIRDRGRG
jgi:hypothetical protein